MGDGYVHNVIYIDFLEFSYFIAEMDLLDLPLFRRSFTWYQPFGGVASRLDMILISDGWWEL